jgi:hypothetical protein
MHGGEMNVDLASLLDELMITHSFRIHKISPKTYRADLKAGETRTATGDMR